jgi:hypothetical protein
MAILIFGLTSLLSGYSVSRNKEKIFSEMLLMDDSRQRYCDKIFYFTNQGD